jgi:hypothetical protein
MKTVRRDVAQELQRRLQSIRDQSLEQLEKQIEAEPAPSMR